MFGVQPDVWCATRCLVRNGVHEPQSGGMWLWCGARFRLFRVLLLRNLRIVWLGGPRVGTRGCHLLPLCGLMCLPSAAAGFSRTAEVAYSRGATTCDSIGCQPDVRCATRCSVCNPMFGVQPDVWCATVFMSRRAAACGCGAELGSGCFVCCCSATCGLFGWAVLGLAPEAVICCRFAA